MDSRELSPEQSNAIKGVAILLIIFHNFFHGLPPKLGENEFNFKPERYEIYLSHLTQFPGDFAKLFFSYFGHHAVAIFVFFSAYGLAIAAHSQRQAGVGKLLRRLDRIYVPFVLCIVIYVLLGLIETIRRGEEVIQWSAIALKMLLISNFIPGEGLTPVGPWWYVPFVIQLYVLMPVFLKVHRRYGNLGLIAMSALALIAEAQTIVGVEGININMNPLGHLPLISFAIYAANSKGFKFAWPAAGLAFLLFLSGSLSYYTWLLSDVFFVVFTVWAARRFMPAPSALLAYFGTMSLYLFLTNGFVRYVFMKVAVAYNSPLTDLAASLASLILVILFAHALKLTEVIARRAVKAGA